MAAPAPAPVTVVSLSDIHGLHLRGNVLDVPEGDVLIIAGDIELRQPRDFTSLERWLAQLPHRHKIVGFGNMDRAAYEAGPSLAIAGAQVAVDSVVEAGGLRVLASPWSPEYAGVWQIESEEQGREHWAALLPPDLQIDVLVTHTPPHGYGDLTRGSHVGDKQLLEAVQALRVPPRLWVCGHIHESVGEYRVPHSAAPEGILLVNAAVYYAGWKPGWEQRAQPRAVALPEGRVVAQGDPARAEAAARAAGKAAGADEAEAGKVWKAPVGPIVL
ncbi:hypothetical protein HYH03_014171 [Edaphochlamys debaryana]|uniref:Calcineurin-like phosphoesterase domain-containing protein n=1 Tax=Edaphochlamys debaryana TaxID=47281 RepID=A0A836BTT9_9CHLO|nr:hypothetical protein HYH03_014171 [Edaphochlamys debaryana]|eukprot:KAG2487194.1 hypothetical protein HYH03_014171 [Edaphochlamys debaryana]